MRQPLTLEQCKRVVSTAADTKLDAGVGEMLPTALLDYIQSAPDIRGQVFRLEQQLSELNLAIAEYANQSGGGQIMLQNLGLCLDQVRMRRQGGG